MKIKKMLVMFGLVGFTGISICAMAQSYVFRSPVYGVISNKNIDNEDAPIEEDSLNEWKEFALDYMLPTSLVEPWSFLNWSGRPLDTLPTSPYPGSSSSSVRLGGHSFSVLPSFSVITVMEDNGYLDIYNNTNLKIINTFDNLIKLSSSDVSGNSSLESILLPRLEAVETIKINNNPILNEIKLSGLKHLETYRTSSSAFLQINNNIALTNIDFQSLEETSVGSSFYINDNPSLSNINIPNVKALRGFNQFENNNLSNLNFLSNVTNGGNYIYLRGNPLTDISDLENIVFNNKEVGYGHGYALIDNTYTGPMLDPNSRFCQENNYHWPDLGNNTLTFEDLCGGN